MPFGPLQPELMPGAKNAVETCLAVRAEEHVALIADQASAAVAASIAEALDKLKATGETASPNAPAATPKSE